MIVSRSNDDLSLQNRDQLILDTHTIWVSTVIAVYAVTSDLEIYMFKADKYYNRIGNTLSYSTCISCIYAIYIYRERDGRNSQ